jgi:hypothetical protein
MRMGLRHRGGWWRTGRLWVGLTIGSVLAGLSGWAAAEEAMDVQAIVRDTQQLSREAKSLTMVWWMPDEFWEASIRADPAATQSTVDQILTVTRHYTLIAVADGTLGVLGGLNYKSESEVRSTVRLVDRAGAAYAPLDEAAIASDMKNLLGFMRPMIANMLGPLGQNIHFLLFPAQDAQGLPIASAKREGGFSVKVGAAAFKYRLPLGSVLPARFDPKTGERFPGNFLFSPLTAAPLVVGEPGKPAAR